MANRKLAPRFFGPFEVEARVGAVTYRLKLPISSRVHPVFHVSLLKRAIGATQVEPNFPEELIFVGTPFLPASVLQRRTVQRDDQLVKQVLIQWSGLGADEATWMDIADVSGQFPYFHLEDKAVLEGAKVDIEQTPLIKCL